MSTSLNPYEKVFLCLLYYNFIETCFELKIDKIKISENILNLVLLFEDLYNTKNNYVFIAGMFYLTF